MVERAIVADLGRLADDHTHAVIDEYAAADRRSGMNLDARQPPTPMRKPSPQPAEAGAPQWVGDPAVPRQRVQTGVTGEHFPCGAGRGVAVEDDGDVFT